MELFLVQAWILWNQRNKLLHGGMIQDPNMLCKRAVEYLEEYQNSQGNLRVDGVVHSVGDVWKPPPNSVFKLNFDAAVLVPLYGMIRVRLWQRCQQEDHQ